MKKILISIIVIIVILFVIIFAVDKYRMKNNIPVLFSTQGTKYAPPVVEKNNRGKYVAFICSINSNILGDIRDYI